MKKKKESTEEEKAQNILVGDTIFLFGTFNEGVTSLYGRPTERKWTLHLLRKYGFEKVKNMIAFLPTYNKGLKTKWGVILKPSQLVEHLQSVVDAKNKLDRQLEFEIKKEEIDKKNREDDELLKKERDAYTLEQKAEMKKRSDAMFKTIRGF